MKGDAEAPPESDRFPGAPHPRETLSFFGNSAIERELLEAYRQNKLAQAVILGGPEGVGKATLAWRFARFLAAHPDPRAPEVRNAVSLHVPEDAPASRRAAAMALADTFLLRREWNEKSKKHYTEIRVEDVRKLIHFFHHGAGSGGWRVGIVDCADDLNRSSANALLKLVEEPPERSLFLLVAHQPGRLLPTIRSRCRRLHFAALSEAEVAEAVRALGRRWRYLPSDEVAGAARRAEGSVREALKLLDGGGVSFNAEISAMLARLPRVDWLAVHALADKLAGREAESAYETFMSQVFRFLHGAVRAGAGQGEKPARLVPYAKAWEEIAQAARETEIFNLDKRALVVSIITSLETAAR